MKKKKDTPQRLLFAEMHGDSSWYKFNLIEICFL